MKGIRFFNREESDKDLFTLEAYLQARLLPVEPRPEFVRDMGSRLSRQFMELEPQERRTGVSPVERYLIVGGAGLVGSLILLLTGVRAVSTLRSAIRYLKAQQEQKRAAQVASAV